MAERKIQNVMTVAVIIMVSMTLIIKDLEMVKFYNDQKMVLK